MSKPQEPDYYDQVWEILKTATFAMKGLEIPAREIPSAMADFLVYLSIALGTQEDISEQIVLSLVERQLSFLDLWREGKHPFGPKGALQ
jgi:hypothetical protein